MIKDRSRKVTYVSLDVEVLEVEGMFPDINANDGDMAQQRILVRGGDDFELVVCRVHTLPVTITTNR